MHYKPPNFYWKLFSHGWEIDFFRFQGLKFTNLSFWKASRRPTWRDYKSSWQQYICVWLHWEVSLCLLYLLPNFYWKLFSHVQEIKFLNFQASRISKCTVLEACCGGFSPKKYSLENKIYMYNSTGRSLYACFTCSPIFIEFFFRMFKKSKFFVFRG